MFICIMLIGHLIGINDILTEEFVYCQVTCGGYFVWLDMNEIEKIKFHVLFYICVKRHFLSQE
jgi:hypothetical protein